MELQICQKPHTYHVVYDVQLSAFIDSRFSMQDIDPDLSKGDSAGTIRNKKGQNLAAGL